MVDHADDRPPWPLLRGDLHRDGGKLAVPAGVVTETSPVEPAPTTARTVLISSITKDWTDVPPMVTELTLIKLVPFIVTVDPLPADVGVMEVTVGGGRKRKPLFVVVPNGLVTATSPLDPSATIAVILLSELMEKELAGVPPRVTAVTAPNCVPVIVTVPPAGTINGEKEVMAGGAVK